MSSRPQTTRPWKNHSRRRPWTAQSRPTTARPQTAASTRFEGSFVVAVIEGRGVSREVGIAGLDRDTGKVVLVQVRFLDAYMRSFSIDPLSSWQTALHTSRPFINCIYMPLALS